ncbi:MAG: threonine synthase [Clostridiales bacterium]|nr:threonine synthase [Clostridiales bacterium]
MFYTSTRDSNVHVTASQAITAGISADGGLFVPEIIPQISLDDLSKLSEMDYVERAKTILSLYLTDFTAQELDECVKGAYTGGKFSDEKIAPLVELYEGVEVLELWKGPTCAFKDMALQLLPQLLTTSAKRAAPGKDIVILVATSGDTGKAALEGFKDVPGTKILVFYPSDGVSPVQKLQMTTQEGDNVSVCAIEGNFDDAQNGVKAIFANKAMAAKLEEQNLMFSSANSINWGRLVPQIVYYISAYCDLTAKGSINLGDKINIVVPTGNFGNILAAYYAMEMGLPVNKLICASNANNVLTEFFETGRYNRLRDFYATASPSMDILISSNLERLLYLLSGKDDTYIKSLMGQLAETGKYTIRADMQTKIQAIFAAGYCDDTDTKATIAATFKQRAYLCDTHTAVAVHVYEHYRTLTSDTTPAVIASTASPFKFSASVLAALKTDNASQGDEFAMLDELATLTGEVCPPQLTGLKEKPVRFTGVCTKESMAEAVLDMLKL